MKYTCLLLIVLLVSCKEDSVNIQSTEGHVELINDQGQFNNAWDDLKGNSPVSDPFSLNSMELNGDVLTVELSHSGGCKAHDYTLLWSEGVTFVNPPQVTAILIHDANNDGCEAYLTNDIDFKVDSIALGWSPADYPNWQLTVVNGSNPEEALTLN